MSVHDSIKVTTFIDPKDPRGETQVRAHLEWTDTVQVSPCEVGEPGILDRAKKMVRYQTLNFLYGDLIEPIRELEYIARMSPDVDVRRLIETLKQIDAIIGDRT